MDDGIWFWGMNRSATRPLEAHKKSVAKVLRHPRRDLWAVCWFVCFLCCGRSVNFESWFCPTIGLSFWDCQGENPCLIVILIGAMAKSLGWYCSWTMHPPFKCVYRVPIQLVPDSQHFSKKTSPQALAVVLIIVGMFFLFWTVLVNLWQPRMNQLTDRATCVGRWFGTWMGLVLIFSGFTDFGWTRTTFEIALHTGRFWKCSVEMQCYAAFFPKFSQIHPKVQGDGIWCSLWQRAAGESSSGWFELHFFSHDFSVASRSLQRIQGCLLIWRTSLQTRMEKTWMENHLLNRPPTLESFSYLKFVEWMSKIDVCGGLPGL